MTKQDLIKQLAKNDELMHALGYSRPEEIGHAVKDTLTLKDGCFLWEEFLDFFFLRQADLGGGDVHWWRKIGETDKGQENVLVDNTQKEQ